MKNAQLVHIKTQEQFSELVAFGAEFNHEVRKQENLQYVAFKVDGETIGYAQVLSVPLVMFAWHPERVVKHRHGLIDAAKKFAGWAKLRFGLGLTGVPENDTAFTPEIMKKLGMRDTGAKLYMTRN